MLLCVILESGLPGSISVLSWWHRCTYVDDKHDPKGKSALGFVLSAGSVIDLQCPCFAWMPLFCLKQVSFNVTLLLRVLWQHSEECNRVIWILMEILWLYMIFVGEVNNEVPHPPTQGYINKCCISISELYCVNYTSLGVHSTGGGLPFSHCFFGEYIVFRTVSITDSLLQDAAKNYV